MIDLEYSNKELYKISKKVYTEAILHQQVQSAGSNKAKFLERLGNQRSNFRTQAIIMKIIFAFYIIVFTVIPVISFMQINIVSGLPFIEDTWNLFAGGLSVSGFMLLQPIILILFSVTYTWGYLSKEPYTSISSLPFSREDISKISFFTFLRGIDIQLIVLFLVLPVGTIIGINLPASSGFSVGKNIFMVTICILVNLANTIFNISIVILLGRKMANIMEGQEENNRMSNFIRITSIFTYLLFSMLASYGIQMAITKIPLLYDPSNQFISTASADIMNKVLSFIPFPFAGGFLLSSIAIGLYKIPILVIIGSVTGTVLQFGLAALMLRKAVSTLQDIASLESKLLRRKVRKKPIYIEVKVSKPTRAYMKRDLALITRELQTITFMIMPIMIPITAALAFELDFTIGSTGIPAIALYIMSFATFSTFFLIIGITSIEAGGETITSSLPISIRDQIKAKIPFLYSTVPLMVIVAVLIQWNKESFIDILLVMVLQLPAIFLIGMIGLFMKIQLFGKFKHKYVIEEVKTEYKTLKYLSVLLVMFLLAAGFIFSMITGYWLTLTLEGTLLILLIIAYFVMFPKKTIKSM